MNDRLSGVISTRLGSRARSRDEVNTQPAYARAGGRLNPSGHHAGELRSLKKLKLAAKKDQTFVLFTHANWKKPGDLMRHCCTKRAIFLLSLKDWLERGEGRPGPYAIKISVDD